MGNRRILLFGTHSLDFAQVRMALNRNYEIYPLLFRNGPQGQIVNSIAYNGNVMYSSPNHMMDRVTRLNWVDYPDLVICCDSGYIARELSYQLLDQGLNLMWFAPQVPPKGIRGIYREQLNQGSYQEQRKAHRILAAYIKAVIKKPAAQPQLPLLWFNDAKAISSFNSSSLGELHLEMVEG